LRASGVGNEEGQRLSSRKKRVTLPIVVIYSTLGRRGDQKKAPNGTNYAGFPEKK